MNKEGIGYDTSISSKSNMFVKASANEPYNLPRVKCFTCYKFSHLKSYCILLRVYRAHIRNGPRIVHKWVVKGSMFPSDSSTSSQPKPNQMWVSHTNR